MEIERKFLISHLPDNLEAYEHKEIEQGYLSTAPVLRIRKEDDNYYCTYKSTGMMSREEYNLPLTRESYQHLREKVDGYIISKTRYLIPLLEPVEDFTHSLTIELDIFHENIAPLIIAEVEFESEAEANAFQPPAWFIQDVTYDGKYHNSYLSEHGYQT